jgi:hypothetical protein
MTLCGDISGADSLAEESVASGAVTRRKMILYVRFIPNAQNGSDSPSAYLAGARLRREATIFAVA